MGSENEETILNRIERTTDPRLIHLEQQEFLDSRAHLKECCEEYSLKIDNGEEDWLNDNNRELLELETKLERPLKLLNEELGWYTEKSWFIDCEEVQRLRNLRDTLRARKESLVETIEFRKSGQVLTDDNGAIGMSHICRKGKSEGQLIYLSGSGADEIFSDYGFEGVKHFSHSTIGGLFPDDLNSVFPWKNFFGNTQRAYLMKEEHVSGSYGVEGRYPFLDRDVVQEFLWLKPELKNANYKSVLHHYLKKHQYPFDEAQKVGFNCGFSPSTEGYDPKKSVHRTVGEAADKTLIVDMDLEQQELLLGGIATSLSEKYGNRITNSIIPNQIGRRIIFFRSVTIDDKKQLTKQQKKLVSKNFRGYQNRQRLLQHIRGKRCKGNCRSSFPGHWILSGAEINIPDNVEPSDVVMASISHSDEISVAVVAKGVKESGLIQN